MTKNQNETAASEYRNAGKYHFRPIGSATQGFNGKVHFYTENFGELSDTQEAQLHLDIEAAFKAHNQFEALQAVADAARVNQSSPDAAFRKLALALANLQTVRSK